MTVALLLALLLQDPPQERTLAWKLAEGQKYTVAWRNVGKMRFIAGTTRMDLDMKVDMTGKMSVSSIAKTGQAETLISIRRHEIKGTANGNPLHVLMEDGKTKTAEGVGKEVEGLPKIASQPIWLKISPQGEYAAEGSDEVNQYFGGFDGMIGPTVPVVPVRVGDTWAVTMRIGALEKHGIPKLTGRYKLAGYQTVDGVECARITLNESPETPFRGVKLKHEITREAIFDVAAGRCIRSTMTWKVSGKGTEAGAAYSLEVDVTLGFDLTPIAKK